MPARRSDHERWDFAPLSPKGRGAGGEGSSVSEPLIRLLHAAYAAPADGVTDAELLARIPGA